MQSQTIQERFRDTSLEDFVASDPEIQSKYQQDRERREYEARCREQFRHKQDAIEIAKLQRTILEQQLDAIEACDFAQTLFHNCNKSANGFADLNAIAEKISGAFVIASCSKKLRKLVEASVDQAQQDFDVWTSKNMSTLKALGLI